MERATGASRPFIVSDEWSVRLRLVVMCRQRARRVYTGPNSFPWLLCMTMDPEVKATLERDRTVDITTTGRRSGRTSRIETWFYRSRGRYFLSGSPGKRDWQANLIANPRMKFHLKESMTRSLDATAIPIKDADERRAIISGFDRFQEGAATFLGSDLDAWVEGSPLIELVFDD